MLHLSHASQFSDFGDTSSSSVLIALQQSYRFSIFVGLRLPLRLENIEIKLKNSAILYCLHFTKRVGKKLIATINQ